MRWKIDRKPKEGDKKTVAKFAWFPTQVEDHMVWLERYVVDMEYKLIVQIDEGIAYPVPKWVETKRYLACYYV